MGHINHGPYRPGAISTGIPALHSETLRDSLRVGYNLRETTEIRMKKSDMIQRVNTTLVTLGVGNDKVISKIFNTQCAHFCGAQAWRFEDSAVEEFQVMWNRCVRRVLSLPHMTHRRYLPHLIGAPSAMDQIYCRFIKMQ